MLTALSSFGMTGDCPRGCLKRDYHRSENGPVRRPIRLSGLDPESRCAGPREYRSHVNHFTGSRRNDYSPSCIARRPVFITSCGLHKGMVILSKAEESTLYDAKRPVPQTSARSAFLS